jgi:alpha-mannosidase
MLSCDGTTGPAIPTPDAQEFKTYSYEYSLYPHRNNWLKADCFMPAYEFNQGLIGFQLPVTKGKQKLPSKFSFIEIKPNNIILVALKKAENINSAIMRLFETKGQKTKGIIRLFKEPISVEKVNLLEEDEGHVDCRGDEINISVGPFEILSLKIRF